MKYFLVSTYHEGSLSWYCARALNRLGNQVKIFYPWKNADIRFRVLDKIKIPYKIQEVYRSIGNTLVKKIKRIKPDILFVIKGIEILPDTLIRIKSEIDCILINWWPDDPHLNEIARKLAPFYDYFFTHNRDIIQVYNQYGAQNVFCLHFACDPEIHTDLYKGDERYLFDLTFIGGWGEEREKYLERFAQFNLSIWGPQWNNVRKDSPLKTSIRGGQVLGKHMTRIYNRSKIVLNIHTTFEGLRGGVNMRTFEIPACRGFQLVDKKKEIPELFNEKEEIVSFENMEEAFSLIKYYLAHDKERERIAQEGQKRAYSCHTYIQRMEELASIIKNDISYSCP